MTLTDAIAAAGGLPASAYPTHLEIRYLTGVTETCSLLNAQSMPDKNPKILPGATIWAQKPRPISRVWGIPTIWLVAGISGAAVCCLTLLLFSFRR